MFKDGSMIGLNTTLLNQYVEYIANRRLKALGLNAIFDPPVNTNPLPWTQHWFQVQACKLLRKKQKIDLTLSAALNKM